jgi:hypothetical protein
VSTVDSGNSFGTHVFWTTVIPNSDVQVNPFTGTAQMHVRNLPELDYYSPEGTGDLASLGPTWQTGYFDSTVSIDVVWNRPVTRLVNVRDAANGFAGVFAENQATVTWSVSSASGFSFTSNPGNFSTSDPEVPGVSGGTAPLNFFAQVAFERNGIFFPQGEMQSASGFLSGVQLATPAILPMSAVGWGMIGTNPPGEILLESGTVASQMPSSTVGDNAQVNTHPIQSQLGSNRTHLWAAQPGVLDQAFADLERSFFLDAFRSADSLTWGH